jgi:glutamate synthase domain-containing protein 1
MKYTRSLFSPSIIFLILIAAAALAFYGCGNDQQKDDKVMDEMHNTNGDHMDEGQMSEQEMPMLGEEVVRKGAIDVKSIDENKDGMVYQDMMDWNVISDEPGKCPLCKMTLKEVAVKEAKENLLKNDFKVKSN